VKAAWIYTDMETSPIDAALGAMLAATLTASPLPAVIDAEQAATLLQCSKCQVEMLAERGEVPGTKFGRGWIFGKRFVQAVWPGVSW